MSYTKQYFTDGQTLTASQLNHMEDGIAAAQEGSGAELAIGTVASGDTASASIEDGKLNLVLPKGDKGAAGSNGLSATMSIGHVTSGQTASANVRKNVSAASLNDYALDLTLPKGDKGEKGDKGDTGAQGPQGPAGDAGTAGTAPTYKPGKLGCVPFAQPAGSDYAQIIIYGQSLASGTESQVARTDAALDGVYMVGSSAHWYKAATLTGLNPCKNDGFESPIVAAVNHFATMYRRYRDAGQKFIANSTGLGGRSIERLSKGCTSYSYEYLYKDAFLDYLRKTPFLPCTS